MDKPANQDVSVILAAAADGDSRAAAELLPLVYDELRKLAKSHLARNAPGNTLQATALVHEAYLRLVGVGEGHAGSDGADPGWKNRAHFFASAALAMRRIIVDHARKRGSLKRGGDRRRVDADDVDALVQAPTEEILAVDEAVSRLEKEDPRKGQIVNLRFFAGLSFEEIAMALGVSLGTVEREWRYIKRWLYAELKGK